MTPPQVMGYCWPPSAAPGEEVTLALSATTGTVNVEVARVGAVREVVARFDAVAVGDHPVPDNASSDGCGWPAAMTLTVDDEWASGYYEVLLRVSAGGGAAVDRTFLVVRPAPTSRRRSLLVLGTNTWHAYNDFGGTNLYNGGTQVSLARPMGAGFLHKPPGHGRRVASVGPPDPQIAGHIGYLFVNGLSEWAGSAGWPNWEAPFVAWAEANGYAFDVATNTDIADDPDLLGRYRLMLSVGHDEYWSAPMRNAVESFIDDGSNVAFLSGNTACWQVRFTDDGETMVGYKQRYADDPVYGTDRVGELTSLWSDHEIGRPENTMTGVTFTRGGYARIGRRVPAGSGGYTIHRPDHWLFAGTGLSYGDVLGAGSTVVGYECDGCDFTVRDGLPHPTGADGTPTNFEMLATSPAAPFTRDTAARPPGPGELSELEFNAERVLGSHEPEVCDRLAHGHAVLGTYTGSGSRGGTVVTAGCTDWAMGLAARDPQIETITHTILTRLGDAG